MMDLLKINSGSMDLAQVRLILSKMPRVAFDKSWVPGVEQARAMVETIIQEGQVTYGINTGFGKLADKTISSENLALLQANLIHSHATGVGPLLKKEIIKLILILKINCLSQGLSGVRATLIDYLEKIYNSDIIPMIPAKGSVGASGDLAPLAHMSLLLLGEGDALIQNTEISAINALKTISLSPLQLQPKEGLSLINGTQVSTAILCYALYQTQLVFNAALAAGSLTWCAVAADRAPLDPRIHGARRQQNQIIVAAFIQSCIEKIPYLNIGTKHVQNPYSIRCQPQVMGACLSVMKSVASLLENEINAVTDNPLVFSESQEVIPGGNFHAQPIAFAADQLACVLAEIGSLSERRTYLLCDAGFSGLPDFLVEGNGLNSGFMMLQVTAAALCSENKMYAHPLSVDSIPTSGNQEDHVSMATSAAFRLLEMVENVASIVGIECLAACQGADLRKIDLSHSSLLDIYNKIREQSVFLSSDRKMDKEMNTVKNLILNAEFELPIFFNQNINVFSSK